MDWPTLFRAPPASVALRYRTGLRKAPAGETLLVVSGDGRVEVEHWRDAEHRRFEGKLSAAEVRALFGSLEATGFPKVLAQTVPPGSGLIAVELSGAPEHVPALMHRSFVRDLPAWVVLVAKLDALCATASGGAVKPTG